MELPALIVAVGKELTVTLVALEVALQPFPLVTVTVYDPVVEAVIAEVVAPVLHK